MAGTIRTAKDKGFDDLWAQLSRKMDPTGGPFFESIPMTMDDLKTWSANVYELGWNDGVDFEQEGAVE